MKRRKVFSGVQPTGNMHIGNFLGAFRNWVALQDEYEETIYCIVDLHALTLPIEPDELHDNRLEAAKLLLATGIDPGRSLVYLQSQVPQHAELSWILGTLTPMGVLNRMTQYKEKSGQSGSNVGLYAYPVLMAADILLHRADLVPVGDDQRQHLEMTRDLAERFNNRYGEVFPVPDALIPPTSARVMSLSDPTAKMSKSDPNEKSRILMLDSPDDIRAKIKSAVTDSDPEVAYDWDKKAGISNLLEIFAGCTGRSIDDLVAEYATSGYGNFKEAVAEAIVAELAPVRARYRELDDPEVARLMQKGALDARTSAERYQQEVRRVVGLDSV